MPSGNETAAAIPAAMADIEAGLKRLRMCNLKDQLEDLLACAEQARLSHREFLALALSKEIAGRETKRLKLGIQVAHFPRVCTLENFDLSFVPSLDPGTVRDLARLDWVRDAHNVIFLGPPGVGKTHLAIALGRKAVEAGYTVFFVNAADLVAMLEKAEAEGRLKEKLAMLLKPKVLIIDELGYLPVKPSTAYLLFRLVEQKYEKSSLILTSNRQVSDWPKLMGELTVTTAILDRMVHHCQVVKIRGESYRMMALKRRNALKGVAQDS